MRSTNHSLRSAFRVMLFGSGLLVMLAAIVIAAEFMPIPVAADIVADQDASSSADDAVPLPLRTAPAESTRTTKEPAATRRDRSPGRAVASRPRNPDFVTTRPAASVRSTVTVHPRVRLFLEAKPHRSAGRDPRRSAVTPLRSSTRKAVASASGSHHPAVISGRIETSPSKRPFESRKRRTPSGLEARLIGLQTQVERLNRAQHDRQSQGLDRVERLLQQLQTTNRLQTLENRLRKMQLAAADKSTASPSASGRPSAGTGAAPSLPPTPSTGAASGSRQSTAPVMKAQPSSAGSDRYSLQIQGEDIKQVLEMLGQLAGMNILVGKDVTGTVTANLKDVTVEQALNAILRSMGFTFQRENDFLFVMTRKEADSRQKVSQKLITKVYRPHYISVKDLQALVTPLITEKIGKIAMTSPAEVGIALNAETAGGDQISQRDALLVVDYPTVITQIDGVLKEMDVPPRQVAIDVEILSVRLTDDMAFGVNFAILNANSKQLVSTGNGQVLNTSSGFPGGASDSIVPAMGRFIANAAGLKYGFLQGDISGFIEAIEKLSDTNLIASPHLRVLNKQRAELIIGEKLGFKTITFQNNQAIEDIKFIDVGTKLVLRPFIAPDGLVRLEIHPERSSGDIDENGVPQTKTTEVTTNVMVRNGSTIVIGGLIDEEIIESNDRVPLLGAIPLVGKAFGNKREKIVRNELIVLITPRIVREPEDAAAGEAAHFENTRRQEYVRDHLEPIGRGNLARMEFRLAERYFEEGELERARRHVRRSLRQNKNYLPALRLLDQIDDALERRKPRWFRRFSRETRSDVGVVPRLSDAASPRESLPPSPPKRQIARGAHSRRQW